MRIRIRADGYRLSIRLPSCLIFSRLSAAIIVQCVNRSQKERRLSFSDTYALCKQIKRLRRERRDWYLVDIESSGGEVVKIRL